MRWSYAQKPIFSILKKLSAPITSGECSHKRKLQSLFCVYNKLEEISFGHITVLFSTNHELSSQSFFAWLAGAVEYTDCFSTEGKTPPQTTVLDMTLNNLIVRFLLGNAEYHFIAIAPRSTLARSGSTW